jgi:hypothetical protein
MRFKIAPQSSLKRTSVFLGILFFLLTNCSAQSANTCAEVHDGLFYLYPKNTGARLVDIRQGDEVLETEIGKKDTTRWAVKWINDCIF